MDKVANESVYRNRIIDSVIDTYLKVSGAVCIEGPKWCGKTWTSSHHANSEFLVGDPNNNFSNRQLAELSPSHRFCFDNTGGTHLWADRFPV